MSPKPKHRSLLSQSPVWVDPIGGYDIRALDYRDCPLSISPWQFTLLRMPADSGDHLAYQWLGLEDDTSGARSQE